MSTLEMLTDTGVRIEVKTWVVVVLVWILTEIGDMNGVERVLVKIHAGKMLKMISCITSLQDNKFVVIRYFDQISYMYS